MSVAERLATARYNGLAFMEPGTTGPVLSFGIFELDLKSGQLRKGGVRLKLRPQAFRVLALLASRSGDLVTRDEIRKEIWSDDLIVDFDQGLNFCIRQIRSVLADSADAPRFIETIPRNGYRFLAPVQTRGGDRADVPAPTVPAATQVIDPLLSDNGLSSHAQVAGTLPRRQSPRLILAAVFAAAGIAIAAFLWVNGDGQRQRAADLRIRSIAVLPLANLSGNPGQEFFADGMTEALIDNLSALQDVRVVSRTSVMQYKQRPKRVREIAEELKVDAVVEGSVQRSAERVRISVRLMRGGSEDNLWSKVYERNLTDVLSLQSELAEAITRQIESRLIGRKANAAGSHSVSPGVYESYLRGRFELNKGSRNAVEESVKHFETAIAGDPTFASAFSALGNAYTRLGSTFTGASSVSDSWPKALAAARKALELDPDSSEGRAVLATALAQNWEWDEAETEYRRALDLDPNNSLALYNMGELLVVRMRTEEGLALARKAREVDPLTLDHCARIGWLLYHARRYEDADRELRTALALDPNHRLSRWFLAFILIEKQQFTDAIQVLEQVVSRSEQNPAELGVLARAYARSGRAAEANRIIDELKRRRRVGYIPPAPFVHAYAGLADHQQTLVWLERAFQEHSNIIRHLRTHPIFDPLRENPQFINLLQRSGI